MFCALYLPCTLFKWWITPSNGQIAIQRISVQITYYAIQQIDICPMELCIIYSWNNGGQRVIESSIVVNFGIWLAIFLFQGNPWWTTKNNWFNWCQWKWWCWYLDSCWGCWWLCDRTYRKETEGLFLLTSPILSIFSFSWKFYCIIFKMFKLSEQNSFMGLISYSDLW